MVIPFQDKLYRFAYRIVGNDMDAQDVIQEVLIKLWKKKDDLINVDNKEAWCMTVTRNLAIDWLRKKKMSTQDIETSYSVKDSADTPYEKIERQSIVDSVRASIQSLPSKQSQAIHLRDIEGYSYKEIAEMMDINVGQVKILIFRGRQALKTFIKEHHTWISE